MRDTAKLTPPRAWDGLSAAALFSHVTVTFELSGQHLDGYSMTTH